MQNVLLVGNAQSLWVKEYVKHIHCFVGNKVLLTDYYGLSEAEKAFYDNLGVGLLDVTSDNGIKRMLKCYKAFNSASVNAKGKIDVIDIQSPPHSIQAKILEKASRKMGVKPVITFWGSDILMVDTKGASRMKGLLDCSEYINIGTKHMHDKLREFYGDVYDDKCRYVGFGSPALETIKDLKSSIDKCKLFFGLDPIATTIAIGYNGRKEQQHLKVIEQLSKLDEPTKERIQIVMHLAYGLEDAYKTEIEKAITSAGVKCKLLEDFYDLETMAMLRKATDIMIHAQVSDGLSGSIRETVYAGSTLLNPSWIRYDRFDEEGVDYIKYDSFDELPEIISNVIEGKVVVDKERNRRLIYDGYSWDYVRDKWMAMFNG